MRHLGSCSSEYKDHSFMACDVACRFKIPRAKSSHPAIKL